MDYPSPYTAPDLNLTTGYVSSQTNREETHHSMEYRENAVSSLPVGVNIVLADDDEDDRELFKEALEGLEKVKIRLTEDGESLLSLLNMMDTLPDLIFLDLNMPNKNGRECLTEIRNSPHLSQIPVIIYSTSTAERDVDDTYEGGANLYVSKPFSFKELKKVINKVVLLDWADYQPRSCRKKFYYSL